MDKRKPLVQWSIRELIAVLVTGTLVIGSMWAHPVLVWVVMLLALLLIFGLMTIAIVGRSDVRWFATGFTVFAVGYFATLVVVERSETQLPQFLGQLPTTYLLMNAQQSLTCVTFEKDGKPIPAELEAQMDEFGNVVDRDGNKLGNAMGGFSMPTVKRVQTPGPFTYHTLGQTFFMILFGYLGGKFAVGFARYQARQEEIPAGNG